MAEATCGHPRLQLSHASSDGALSLSRRVALSTIPTFSPSSESASPIAIMAAAFVGTAVSVKLRPPRNWLLQGRVVEVKDQQLFLENGELPRPPSALGDGVAEPVLH